ncbi:tetratricopeptide repeat protein [Lentisphaerota bacterium WC36G]|nr:tetratricopeptide repeat protein [Lentisphaerae bacterium WC36]
MIKKLEIIGVSILIVIGLIWGGGEIYLRNFANNKKLFITANKYKLAGDYFKAKLIFYLSYKAKNKKAATALAEIYQKHYQFAQAINWYKKAYQLSAKDSRCSIAERIAKAYTALSQREKAIEWYKKTHSDGEFVLSNIGDLFIKPEEFSEAEKWYKKAFKKVSWQISLLDFYDITNQSNKKKKFVAQVYSSKDIYRKSSVAHHFENSQKNYQQAIKFYSNIAIKDPQYYYSILEIAEKAGKYQKGITAYKKMTKKDKDSYLTKRMLANCYFNMEDYQSAYSLYLDILQKCYDDNNILKNLTMCSQKLNYISQTIEDINRLKNSNLKKYTLGYIYYKIGDIEKSNATFDIKPGEYYTYSCSSTAHIFMKNQDYDQAIKFFKLAALSSSGSASLYNNFIGNCYLNLNQYQNAIIWYEKIIPFNSENANELLGNCYQKMGHLDEAIKCYQKNSNSRSLKRAISLLLKKKQYDIALKYLAEYRSKGFYFPHQFRKAYYLKQQEKENDK